MNAFEPSETTPASAGAPLPEQPPDRERSPFSLQIANTDLVYRTVKTDDPMPTGRDLVELSGAHPIEEHLVLAVLPTGDLEDVRLNETFDLRGEGAERFIVTRSDRTFRLALVDKVIEWPATLINGATLKKLGGQKPDQVAVLLERRDEADQEIADAQFVDLSLPGVERFYFREATHTVSILVNRKDVQIGKGERSGLEIKQTAIDQGVQIQLDFVLSLHKEGGQTKIIGDNDRVKVHDGQRFTAVADDDKS